MSAAVKLSSPDTHQFWEIPVLYEDEHLLALDKPAGLLVSPDRLAPERPSLTQLVRAAIQAGKPWARERNLAYLTISHRLDPDTTGVLLLVKDKASLVSLADQFGSDRPLKKYLALVQGSPAAASFLVDQKIAPHPLKPGEMRIDSRNGKISQTDFALVEQFSRWSLVRCAPHTERAQQIALHLAHAGFPLVGDETHGGKKLWLSRLKRDFHLKPGREERPLISRPLLHAEDVTFRHPATGQPVSIKSEWPKDLRVAVKYLRQYARSAAGEP